MLQRAATQTAGQVLVLGVDTLDSTDSARSFLRAVRVTYPQVVDEAGILRGVLHGPGLPNTVVIAPDGSIAYRKLGELSVDDLAKALAAVDVTLDREALDRSG